MADKSLVAAESAIQAMQIKAEMLYKSGYMPDTVKNPQQVFAILTIAEELGIGFWAALDGVNVIYGKPTPSPKMMLALIQRTGQLEDMHVDGDRTQCAVTMKRRGQSPHTATFTMQDAALIKTKDKATGNAISLNEKYNWRQMPAVMLQWRAIAACARVVFPDVLLGFSYMPEEINPDVVYDEDGDWQIDETDDEILPPQAGDIEEAQPVQNRINPPHFMEDEKTRNRVWASLSAMGYDADEIHNLLGVESLYHFEGTAGDILTIASQHRQRG